MLIKQKKIVPSKINNQQVRVRPINVGICSSDIPRCFDNKAYFYPLVIGHEFIVSVIEDPSGEFNFGDKCVIFPLIPCLKCEGCLSKEYNKCSNYSYYGSRTEGGMQSFIDINKWNLVRLPSNIDDISGSFIEPIAVCNHASKLVERDKNILIYGGGFLSQILSQILIKNNLHWPKQMDQTIIGELNQKYRIYYPYEEILIYVRDSKLSDSPVPANTEMFVEPSNIYTTKKI